MAQAKDLRDLLEPGEEIRPGIYHHPESPDASVEKLLRVAGILSLTGPVPSHKFLEDEDEGEEKGRKP